MYWYAGIYLKYLMILASRLAARLPARSRTGPRQASGTKLVLPGNDSQTGRTREGRRAHGWPLLPRNGPQGRFFRGRP